MKKREQIFTTKFQKWLKANWKKGNAYFEIKCSTTNLIPFSVVKDHQINNLQIKKFIYKFSDGFMVGTPFDVIFCEGKGYIVIYFYRPRNKEFFIIPIERWLWLQNSAIKKSLKEKEIKELGTECYLQS